MSHTFFREPLEGVATFWRILRRDGVTLGFTAHDRDLYFDGILHCAAPGMVPTAIRLDAGLRADSAEIAGALSHTAIASADLAAGRYDGACIEIGAVDWESCIGHVLYRGEIGAIQEEAGSFSAEMLSSKAQLEADTIPRTSPTCRAEFCGPGCTLNPVRFTHDALVASLDLYANCITIAGGPEVEKLLDGHARWLDGPHAGLTSQIVALNGDSLVLELPIDPLIAVGARLELREGCNHTFETCRSRFANSVNFQGEPFLPGNDLLARYPSNSS